MDCESVRERITAEPAVPDPEFDRHAAGCASCRAYRKRLFQTEALISRALQFDVPNAQQAHLAMPSGDARRTRRVAIFAGLAAGVVSAVTLWFWVNGHRALTPEQLAAEVVEHWYREPESWITTGTRVSGADLDGVLAGAATLDVRRLDPISFAKRCWVAGEQIPHLVVQGESGPVMVLLLPHRALASPVPLELRQEGLSGQIVPAGTGSIAVLGADVNDTVQLERLIGTALEWSI